jgi:integrase
MATIRKRGARYHVQVRRRGQPQVTKSFALLDDARQWARMMEVKADRRELPMDPRALDKLNLGELVKRYRDTVVSRKRGAKEFETIILNAFLRDYPTLCGKALSNLTASDFVSYRDARRASVAAATLKRQLVPLRHMFEVARDEWGLPVLNPLEGLSLEDSARRERRLRPGELSRLLRAAEDCQNPLIGRVILFALETGMRRGEILRMRYRDIDWSEPSLLIPYTKNGHARTIPLSAAAVALLTPSTAEKPFPLTAVALRLAWDRLCIRAGVEDLHFHDLRHEAISRFFEKGLNVPEVALISGHRDMRMLFRYTHAQRRLIVRKLA